MSYHLGPSPIPTSLVPISRPQYQLLPLAQVPSAPLVPAGLDAGTKRILIIIGIFLLAVVAFAIFSNKKNVRPNRAPIKRVSTPELAKNLYERLDRRGNANETTMRSLKAYASKR